MRRLLVLAAILLFVGCSPEPNTPDPAPPPKQGEGCTPPKVVAFCATWCGPCKAAQPTLKWLEKQGVTVVHVDVDKYPDLCREYGVTSYPTFFVYIFHRDTVRTQDIEEVVKACYWLKGNDKGDDHGQTEEMPKLP